MGTYNMRGSLFITLSTRYCLIDLKLKSNLDILYEVKPHYYTNYLLIRLIDTVTQKKKKKKKNIKNKKYEYLAYVPVV